jgi:Fe-S cluster assembly protein SufD
MMEVTLDNDPYVARHQELEKAGAAGPSWLASLRRKALDRYASLGFPTTKLEDWRFTNVQAIAGARFAPAPAAPQAFDLAELERVAFGGTDLLRLVFVNGRPTPALGQSAVLPAGVTVMPLAEALKSHPALVEAHLGRHARWEDHAFGALNTALFEDGLFVHVAKGVACTTPVHVIYATAPGSDPVMTHPRNLIVAEESAEVRVIESYLGRRGVYLTNLVTEIVAAENAKVDHYRLQRESIDAFHVAITDMHTSAAAVASNQIISFGGAITRNDTGVVLGGPGADATLNGLTVIDGSQLVDNHTSIDHAMPHCTSHELYKAVLDGTAKSVFNGRILVRKDAQKTDSKQTNKNMLLSDTALVNTNPQLEIYADDVKCTHGATIGQLDEGMVFYLRSRGIAEQAARHILTYAFANDIVERLKVEALRERLDEYLVHRLREEDGVEGDLG